MLFAECTTDYLQYILRELGLSKNTYEGYKSNLRHFATWAANNGHADLDTSALTTPLLRKYLYWLGDKGLRPRTVRGYFHSIRGICQFCLTNGLLQENPNNALRMPKKDAAQRLTVSDKEIVALLAACERQKTDYQIAFYRAVISTLIYSALRRAELCNLRVSDINLAMKNLLVRSGKGGKSRTVPLSDSCVFALSEWLAVRPTDCRHDYLFALSRARRMHYEALPSILETVKAHAGFRGAENIKPHSIRHWRATDLLLAGMDFKSIQVFLGHSRLETTVIYLHEDEQRIAGMGNVTRLLDNSQARFSEQKSTVSQTNGPTSPVKAASIPEPDVEKDIGKPDRYNLVAFMAKVREVGLTKGA